MKVDSCPEPAEYPNPREGVPTQAECAVYLLGPMRIERGGRPVEGGWRRKSLELLAYLGVHPRGVARDQILEALWPDGDPRVTQRYLWHSASYLRSRLRGAGVDVRVTRKIDELYRLNFDAVWVDVRAFEQTIRQAGSISDPRALLAFACDIYKGEFCEGRYFGWATLIRERLRSQFIESSRRLAELLEREWEPQGALVVLDRALASDPYDEELVRRAIRLEADLGRRDLAVRRFRRLRRLLVSDLNVEVSGETVEILRLITSADSPLPSQPGVEGLRQA